MALFTTVLWDVDNTLLDFQLSQRYALEKTFEANYLMINEEIQSRYDEINHAYWKRFELGEVTKEELLKGRFLTLFDAFGIQNVDLPEFMRVYQTELGNVFFYLDDSIHLCEHLKGRVNQYVITNGVTATQKNKLKLSGLWDCMQEIFVSEDAGIQKPYPGFFEYCLGKITEKNKEKILVIGDSLSSDIKGAVLSGLKSCWYNPKGEENTTEYIPDFEIRNLWDVLKILAEE